MLVSTNDENEKFLRRKSRILADEIQKTNDAKDMAHYGDCLRLAAENKITTKNAFNLHLLDYINDIVNSANKNSFQMATSSLDAGVKIYSSRVDAIHQETYQVLTGLTDTSKKPKNEEDNEAPNDDSDISMEGTNELGKETLKIRKKNVVKKNVFVKDISKIRGKQDMGRADIEPLFQQQAMVFNGESTAQLSLNRICLYDNQPELSIDMANPVDSISQKLSSNNGQYAPMPYLFSNFAALKMCNSFRGFKMSCNSYDDISELTKSFDSTTEGSLEECPIPDLAHDNDEDIADPPEICEAVVSDNQIKAEEKLQSEVFVSSLKNMLFDKINACSKDHDSLLGLWAGPELWSKKCRKRIVGSSGNKISGRRSGKKCKLLTYDNLELSEDYTRSGKMKRCSWKDIFRYPGDDEVKRMMLTEDTLAKNRCINHLLPLVEPDQKNLTLMLSMREMPIMDLENKEESRELVDNDRTIVEEIDDDCGFEAPLEEEGSMGCPFSNVFTQETNSDAALKLLSQPRNIQSIDIQYAKSAKTINARLLKGHMWTRISEHTRETETNGTITSKIEEMEDMVVVPKSFSDFSDIIFHVPLKVDSKTCDQLSVPIMLNCLLHLANEKNLFIESTDDNGDLKVYRYIPLEQQNLLAEMMRSAGCAPRKRQTTINDWFEDDETLG